MEQQTSKPVFAVYAFKTNGDFHDIHSVHTAEKNAEIETKRLMSLGAFGALEVVKFNLPLPDGSPIKPKNKPDIVLA